MSFRRPLPWKTFSKPGKTTKSYNTSRALLLPAALGLLGYGLFFTGSGDIVEDQKKTWGFLDTSNNPTNLPPPSQDPNKQTRLVFKKKQTLSSAEAEKLRKKNYG